MPSLVEIGPVVLEKITFKFASEFPLFRFYLLLEKRAVLHLSKLKHFVSNNCFVPSIVEIGLILLEKNFVNVFSFDLTWIPFTQECSVPSLIEIGILVLEKRILNFVKILSFSCYDLLLEKGEAFIWTPLSSFHLRMRSGDNNDGQHTNCDQKSSITSVQMSYKSCNL